MNKVVALKETLLPIFGVLTLLTIGYKLIACFQRYAGWPGYSLLGVAIVCVWAAIWCFSHVLDGQVRHGFF